MFQIIIAIVIAVTLAGSGVYYYLSAEPTKDIEQNTDRVIEGAFVPQVNTLAGTGNFQDLLDLQQDISCTVSYNVEGQGQFSGEIYVSKTRMRGDLAYVFDGNELSMHVIQNDEVGYTWGSAPIGDIAMKYPITPSQSEDPENSAGFDYDQKVTYSCAPWKVDTSVFVPPSDIPFKDMSDPASMYMDINSL